MSWREILENVPRWMLRGSAVLAVVLVGFQMVRGDALVCANGAIFARSCAATDLMPIGAVVAYFGVDENIPVGWALCDGRDHPASSLVDLDANSERDGKQLPDMTHRFVRGAGGPLNTSALTIGGSDETNTEHNHRWVHRSGNNWNSYNAEGTSIRVDNWNDGVHNRDSGTFPFNMAAGREVFTSQDGVVVDNLPSFVELRFIIRVF